MSEAVKSQLSRDNRQSKNRQDSVINVFTGVGGAVIVYCTVCMYVCFYVHQNDPGLYSEHLIKMNILYDLQ